MIKWDHALPRRCDVIGTRKRWLVAFCATRTGYLSAKKQKVDGLFTSTVRGDKSVRIGWRKQQLRTSVGVMNRGNYYDSRSPSTRVSFGLLERDNGTYSLLLREQSEFFRTIVWQIFLKIF